MRCLEQERSHLALTASSDGPRSLRSRDRTVPSVIEILRKEMDEATDNDLFPRYFAHNVNVGGLDAKAEVKQVNWKQ